jgi:hypothetical protein
LVVGFASTVEPVVEESVELAEPPEANAHE